MGNVQADMTRKASRKAAISCVLSAAVMAAGFPPIAHAETRSFVVSNFSQGTRSGEGDCPGGINPGIEEQWRRELVSGGMKPEEAAALVQATEDGDRKSSQAARDAIINRATINGKPANAYANPAAI